MYSWIFFPSLPWPPDSSWMVLTTRVPQNSRPQRDFMLCERISKAQLTTFSLYPKWRNDFDLSTVKSKLGMTFTQHQSCHLMTSVNFILILDHALSLFCQGCFCFVFFHPKVNYFALYVHRELGSLMYGMWSLSVCGSDRKTICCICWYLPNKERVENKEITLKVKHALKYSLHCPWVLECVFCCSDYCVSSFGARMTIIAS